MDQNHTPMSYLAVLAALGAGVDLHSMNDFTDHADEIVKKFHDLFGLGDRFTYRIHLGSRLTYFEDQSTGGENFRTMLVGDKKNSYVRINNHGADLGGLVSVHIAAIKNNGKLELVLDIYPVTIEDGPLSGLIWMDDPAAFGDSASKGNICLISANHKSFTLPRQGSLIHHFLQDFCFGIVNAQPRYSNTQIIMTADIDLMLPVGHSPRPLVEEFVLAGQRKLNKPEDMSETRFQIVQMAFKESIAILSQEALTARFTRQSAHFDANEIAKFILVIHRMVNDGWFSEVLVESILFFVPTPKLLLSI